MQRIVRYRKAFYEKQNDFQTGNTKHHQPFKCEQNLPCQPDTPKTTQHKQKDNSQLFCELYAREAIQGSAIYQHKTLFLANHKIDALLRARMLDWMIEVTSSYKFSDKGYFDSVQLMDRYFEKETTALLSSRLHIVGVTSMLIASKINELNPLKIKTVFEKIAHRKLSLNDILVTEANIIHKLDYKLNAFTFYDLACIKLSVYFYSDKRILHKVDRNVNQPFCSDQGLERALSIASYLSKLALFDYEFYCQQSTLLLAECIVKTSLELGQFGASLEFSNTAVDLQMCRMELFKGIKRFKQCFKGLNNVFKFTAKEVARMVENCLE